MNELAKTKKIRKENNKQLWNLFDSEINSTNTNIECIYRQYFYDKPLLPGSCASLILKIQSAISKSTRGII